MSKRDLLRELLPIIAQNRACQRLVLDFTEYLNQINEREQQKQKQQTGNAQTASTSSAIQLKDVMQSARLQGEHKGAADRKEKGMEVDPPSAAARLASTS